MTDQAESLRRSVLQAAAPDTRSQQSQLLLIFGAAPTMGTSLLSLQLALAWRRRGEATALVEIRRQRPALATPVQHPGRATLSELVRQERTLGEAWLTGPFGLPIITGDLGDHPLPPHHPLADQLHSAAGQQRLLVDVQDLADLLALLPVADHCVFVTTAETDMLMATYGAIKRSATRLRGAGCWVAMSQVIDVAAALQMQARLVTTCDRCLNLALAPLACLPWDPTLASAENRDILASAHGGSVPYRQAIQQAAARIDQSNLRRAGRGRAHDTVDRSMAG